LIGVSATLGSGIYVLAGSIITKFTGPSIILSFIFAGLATLFSGKNSKFYHKKLKSNFLLNFYLGLCYAELGPRVPRSGSAYIYIYVTMGEFLGFIMGWDLILEYIIGVAAVGNALSQYIDVFADRKISSFLLEYLPMNVPGLGPYPDLLAFGLILFMTGIIKSISYAY
jgi:amino acid transporter